MEFCENDYHAFQTISKPLWNSYQNGEINAQHLQGRSFYSWAKKLQISTAQLNSIFMQTMADISKPLQGVVSLLNLLINTKVLTQWKVLLKGRKFWLQSLGSCTISEFLYSFIAILLMEIQSIPISYILKVVALSYSIKMIYNIIFVFPTQVLVNYIRRVTGIDVYDFNHNFTPSKYYKYKLLRNV